VDLGQQDETQPERNEVHAFDEPDHGEEPWQHPALGLRLSCDAAEEGVAGYGVTDAGSNGGSTKRDAEPKQGRGQSNSVVSH
jgi:hypothetical protein